MVIMVTRIVVDVFAQGLAVGIEHDRSRPESNNLAAPHHIG